jgi:uncharacterized protein (DUF1697 family)
MTSWVALLRGVNVGGVTIRNADLAKVFIDLGFAEVRTVLASGNVTFDADDAASEHAALTRRIESALGTVFGYDAWIVLVTRDELATAIADFPFDETDAARQPWVIFCVDDATRDELLGAARAMDAVVDPVAEGARVVYWNPVKGSTTDTPFAKLIAKAVYRPRTTNRNLRTLVKLVD